ncbi:MAG TPA: metallophosphoesterase family protein [Pyrinomonadaceae bacterium]|nr:metallophosphoesterase family protein [Pyrinomonadaceae bacterium]
MSSAPLLIGVISDTHGLLDEKVFELFAGVYRIIHAGDIGDEELIWRLERVAPVIAVRGNNDAATMCFPVERLAVIGGRTFFVRHQFATVEKMSPAQRRLIEQRMPDAVIFGHSHKGYSGSWRGTLLFNPGSAGPRRFNLPRSVGLLEIIEDDIEPRIIDLDGAPA